MLKSDNIKANILMLFVTTLLLTSLLLCIVEENSIYNVYTFAFILILMLFSNLLYLLIVDIIYIKNIKNRLNVWHFSRFDHTFYKVIKIDTSETNTLGLWTIILETSKNEKNNYCFADGTFDYFEKDYSIVNNKVKIDKILFLLINR